MIVTKHTHIHTLTPPHIQKIKPKSLRFTAATCGLENCRNYFLMKKDKLKYYGGPTS